MVEFQQSLPMILYRTLGAVLPPSRAIFTTHDLTEQQWRVLRVLWESDRVTTATLAQATLISSPSLVGVLDRLEKRELIARARSAADRRIIYITSTAKGAKLAGQVLPQIAALHEQVRSTVNDMEWQSMVNVLEKITRGLHEDQQAIPKKKIEGE